ncbi:Abscisic stress-ripening protein 1-like protein [Drosera capensis]
MAEEGKHHHFFHHKEEEGPIDPEKELKHHKHLELLGEAGTVAAGAYALYEKHQAKKNPEKAHQHKVGEEIAAAVAVGAGGFAFHEHHEKKEAKHHLKEGF